MAQHDIHSHKDYLDEVLLEWPGVEAGQMFGHPSYAVQGKVFATVMENGISLKMPPSIIMTLLQQKNIRPFMPVPGQAMRHWIFIQIDNSADVAQYGMFIEQAMACVATAASPAHA